MISDSDLVEYMGSDKTAFLQHQGLVRNMVGYGYDVGVTVEYVSFIIQVLSAEIPLDII